MLTLSIGIPALNEAANIGHLLRALLAQSRGNFVLQNIMVVSDGSTDATVARAREVGDAHIVVVERQDRKGQAARQDEIVRSCTSDLLLLMNADMLPKGDKFLETLVAPFYLDESLGLVSCKGTPLEAETKFEQIINFGVAFKESMVGSLNLGDNVYNCHGHTRIFAKKFYTDFTFGGVVSEDAYSYFACKQKGLTFKYIPEAEVMYRSPQTLRDHLKQSVRFIQGQKQLAKIYDSKLVSTAHALPTSLFLRSSLVSFLAHPFWFVEYFAVSIVVVLVSWFKQHAVLTWETASSSKTLIKP